MRTLKWVYAPPGSGKSGLVERYPHLFFDVDDVSETLKTVGRLAGIDSAGVTDTINEFGLEKLFSTMIKQMAGSRVVLSNVFLDRFLGTSPFMAFCATPTRYDHIVRERVARGTSVGPGKWWRWYNSASEKVWELGGFFINDVNDYRTLYDILVPYAESYLRGALPNESYVQEAFDGWREAVVNAHISKNKQEDASCTLLTTYCPGEIPTKSSLPI